MKLITISEGKFLKEAADLAMALYTKRNLKMYRAIKMASDKYKETPSDIGRELARRRLVKTKPIEPPEQPKPQQLSLF